MIMVNGRGGLRKAPVVAGGRRLLGVRVESFLLLLLSFLLLGLPVTGRWGVREERGDVHDNWLGEKRGLRVSSWTRFDRPWWWRVICIARGLTWGVDKR